MAGLAARLMETFYPKKIMNPRVYPPAYQGRHAGRDLLILGSGPSLVNCREQIRRFIFEQDPVVLSANNAASFMPCNYGAFVNRHRFCLYADGVAIMARGLLIGPQMADWIVKRFWQGPWERLAWVLEDRDGFDVRDGIIYGDCGQTAQLLMVVAGVMGARSVFCAGVDGYAAGVYPNAYPLPNLEHDLQRALSLQARVEKVLPMIKDWLNQQQIHGPYTLTPSRYKTLEPRGTL